MFETGPYDSFATSAIFTSAQLADVVDTERPAVSGLVRSGVRIDRSRGVVTRAGRAPSESDCRRRAAEPARGMIDIGYGYSNSVASIAAVPGVSAETTGAIGASS